MTHTRMPFSSERMEYLNALPAVASVSGSRIRYADWFKRECVRLDKEGKSPATLFREAGLGPELIGSKRIERCMNRWRCKAEKDAWNMNDDEMSSVSESLELLGEAMPGMDGGRLRDMLIIQQAHYIEELERQVESLRRQYAMKMSREGARASGGTQPPRE